MTTYTVNPKKWRSGVDIGSELYVDGVGVTQVDDLGEGRQQARDFIATITDMSMEVFHVEILVEDPVG